MKTFSVILLMLIAFIEVRAQKSEDYIPLDAVTVFSINNITLLQKVSLDELVKYEFMQELQQELFDGSTSGKTIKESGIDFNQKLNVFYGRNLNFEISGFTFGIKDINELFTVFDDFDKQESSFENIQFYSSYLNHLIIKDNIGVLIRVDPLYSHVNEIADSIWSARGYNYWDRYHYNRYDYDYDYDYDENIEEGYEEFPEEEIEIDEEDDSDIYDVEEQVEEIEDTGDLWHKEEGVDSPNYYDIRDSVYAALSRQNLNQICQELFIDGKNLKKADAALASQLTHNVEGTFYLDNSRNVQKSQPFWYYQNMLPSLHKGLSELYMDNKILGDIRLTNNSLEATMKTNYGDALGSIYKELNDSKFDKKVTKYIHKDNSAYFTYNVDLGKAYEKSYEIIMPLLRDEKSRNVSGTVMAIEFMNAFLNKDAIFDTYKGSVFGTFNGVKKIPIRRVIYSYDEDFNYTETEVFNEEDIPIFTLGFSTERNDLPQIFLDQMANLNSEWQNKGKYWKIDNAILNTIPMYIINKGGLFIMTNDENLAVNNPDGFGADKISRKQIKKTKKSGFVYGEVDWSKAIDHLPTEFMTNDQKEMLDAIRMKSGNMTLTSSKTTINSTEFKLVYDFNDTYDNPGKYVLDLVNSLFVIMK